MTPAELLHDCFERVRETALAAIEDLDETRLAERPQLGDGPAANPIGWLVWHLARVQDDHVSALAGREQVWTAQGFVDRLDLGLDPADLGYGHDTDDVARVRVSATDLADYLCAVTEQTLAHVDALRPEDLDVVVDEHWDPPVTAGVRLVSVVSDDLQHAGQAAYVRGLLGA